MKLKHKRNNQRGFAVWVIVVAAGGVLMFIAAVVLKLVSEANRPLPPVVFEDYWGPDLCRPTPVPNDFSPTGPEDSR